MSFNTFKQSNKNYYQGGNNNQSWYQSGNNSNSNHFANNVGNNMANNASNSSAKFNSINTNCSEVLEFLKSMFKENNKECVITGKTGSGKSQKLLHSLSLLFKSNQLQNRIVWFCIPTNITIKSMFDYYKSLKNVKYINSTIKFNLQSNFNSGLQVRNIESTCREFMKFILSPLVIEAPMLMNNISIFYDECHMNKDSFGILMKMLLKVTKTRAFYISATLPKEFEDITNKYNIEPKNAVNNQFKTTISCDLANMNINSLYVLEHIKKRLEEGNVLIIAKSIKEQYQLKKKLNLDGRIFILNSRTTETLDLILQCTCNIIIIATSIVDQGITLPNIHTIYDNLTMYVPKCDLFGKTNICVEKISNDIEEQRQGRGGRTNDTIYYRLYDPSFKIFHNEDNDKSIHNMFPALIALKQMISNTVDLINNKKEYSLDVKSNEIYNYCISRETKGKHSENDERRIYSWVNINKNFKVLEEKLNLIIDHFDPDNYIKKFITIKHDFVECYGRSKYDMVELKIIDALFRDVSNQANLDTLLEAIYDVAKHDALSEVDDNENQEHENQEHENQQRKQVECKNITKMLNALSEPIQQFFVRIAYNQGSDQHISDQHISDQHISDQESDDQGFIKLLDRKIVQSNETYSYDLFVVKYKNQSRSPIYFESNYMLEPENDDLINNYILDVEDNCLIDNYILLNR